MNEDKHIHNTIRHTRYSISPCLSQPRAAPMTSQTEDFKKLYAYIQIWNPSPTSRHESKLLLLSLLLLDLYVLYIIVLTLFEFGTWTVSKRRHTVCIAQNQSPRPSLGVICPIAILEFPEWNWIRITCLSRENNSWSSPLFTINHYCCLSAACPKRIILLESWQIQDYISPGRILILVIHDQSLLLLVRKG